MQAEVLTKRVRALALELVLAYQTSWSRSDISLPMGYSHRSLHPSRNPRPSLLRHYRRPYRMGCHRLVTQRCSR